MAASESSIAGGASSTPAPGMSRAEIEQLVRSVAGASKDDAGVQKILSDNFEYRDTIRGLKAEVEGLKKQVPADGTLVLTAEQRKEWEAFVGIGKPADKVIEALKEGEKATGKVATYEKERLLGEVAEAEGFSAKDAATVLSTIVGKREIVIEPVEEEQEDEQTGDKKKVSVRRAFFKTTGADGVTTKERVKTAVERDHKAFLPALTAAAEEDEGRENARHESGTHDRGTPFTRQPITSTKGGGNEKDVAKTYLSRAYGSRKPA